ncbi:MAG TPA: alpha/beta fold hydrolase [Burkholderiales bacterium]
MRTFVLVHGAWHGGWCWSRAAQRLRAEGHAVFTPTLTGVGERAHLAGTEVNLSLHIRDLCNVLAWEDLTQVVLVGHSYGGMVITGAADAMPERIASLVYLDAFVPEDGKAVWDYFLPERRVGMMEGAQANGGRVPPVPGERFNVNPADRAWVDGKCTPMALACFVERIKLTGAHEKVARHMHILAEGWGPSPFVAFNERLRNDSRWQTASLACGHDAMVDDPEGLTRLLLEA